MNYAHKSQQKVNVTFHKFNDNSVKTCAYFIPQYVLCTQVSAYIYGHSNTTKT